MRLAQPQLRVQLAISEAAGRFENRRLTLVLIFALKSKKLTGRCGGWQGGWVVPPDTGVVWKAVAG
jgi:hypothetical protein